MLGAQGLVLTQVQSLTKIHYGGFFVAEMNQNHILRYLFAYRQLSEYPFRTQRIPTWCQSLLKSKMQVLFPDFLGIFPPFSGTVGR